MLENHYVRPVTIDRIRGPWIAPAIERSVGWLAQQRHIGDYVGHRSASSTQIYGKIAIEQLREVALGDGEDVL